MFARLSATRPFIAKNPSLFVARNNLNKFQYASVLLQKESERVNQVRQFSRFPTSNIQDATKKNPSITTQYSASSILHQLNKSTKQQTRSESTLTIPKPRTQNEKNLYLAGGFLLLGFFYFVLDRILNQGVGGKQALSPTVRKYLTGVYAYLTGGVALSAATAIACWRSGRIMNLMYSNPIAYLLLTTVMCIGTLIACRAVDPRNVVLKNSLYAAFCAIEGVTLASLGVYGGTVIQKAGLYTLGIFLSMSLIAMTAKQERFLYLGGPIYAGFTLMMIASFASLGLSIFGKMPRTTHALDMFIIWGGLLLVTVALLYHTQLILAHGRQFEALQDSRRVSSALSTRNTAVAVPDYIGDALHLYLDLINLFVRLVYIFSGNNRRK